MTRAQRRLRSRISAILTHGILSLGAIFMLLPMIWMLATSFKLPGEIAVWPPHLFPQQPTFSNYSGLFQAAPFLQFFGNSAFISIASTISCVVTSMIALVVLGPKRLPGVMRRIGNWLGRARVMARQLTEQLEREINAEEILKQTKASAAPPPPAAAPPPATAPPAAAAPEAAAAPSHESPHE